MFTIIYRLADLELEGIARSLSRLAEFISRGFYKNISTKAAESPWFKIESDQVILGDQLRESFRIA